MKKNQIKVINLKDLSGSEPLSSNMQISAKSSLHIRNQFLDRIINDSLNMIIAVDQNRNIVEFNQAAQNAFGYKRDEVIGKDINLLYADPAESESIAKQVRENGEFYGRVTNRRKNGEEFVCQISASVLHSEDGQVIGVVGNSRDISIDLQAEKDLQESEETARILLNSSTDSIILIDNACSILDLNENAIRSLSAEDERLIGKNMIDLLGSGESELLKEVVEECIQSRMPIQYESERDVRLMADAKFKVHYTNYLYPIRDDRNQVVRLAIFSKELAESERESKQESETLDFEIKCEAAQKLFRVTVAQLAGIVWCVDRDLRFTLSEGLGLKELGLKPGEVVGMTLTDNRKSDGLDQDELDMHIQALEGHHVEYTTTFNSNIYSCSLSPLRNENGEIEGAIGVAFNITDKKNMEQQLRKEKETYRELVENIDETIFSLDCSGRFTYISPAIESILGYKPEEFIGREFYGYIFPQDFPFLKSQYQDVLNGEARTHELQLPTKNKELRWVRISSKPIYTDGNVAGISGIITDVTDRKNAQIALHESQQKYLNLVENIPVGMFRTTPEPDGRYIMANQTTAKIFGFETTEDIIGSFVSDRYFDPAERTSYLDEVVKSGELVDREEKLKKIDGTPVWCMETIRTVRDSAGKVLHFDGIITDITNRKAAEEKLHISENRFMSIAEETENWIWEIGANLLIRYSNARVKEIIGYEPKEVIGKSLLDFMYDEEMDAERYISDYTLLSDKFFSGHQIVLRHKKGQKVITESTGVPIFRRDRSFVGFQGLTKDITEKIKKKENEELQQQQLIQADKMISLGFLVSGVAHEINNPNQFIMINTPLLRRAWESVEPIIERYYMENGDFPLGGIPYSSMKPRMSELFSGIYNGSQRIKNIVSSLKGYAREGQPGEKSRVSINEVIESSLVIVDNLIKNSTNNLRLKLGDSLPHVEGNFQRLEQVVINLIQNACQALENPQNGIEIGTEYEQDTGNVVVRIVDEGIGIRKRNMKYILDPFYTSKRDSGGTGLGLSISAGIIKDHDGTMEFNSAPGKGTTVIIKLPGLRTG